MLPCPFLTIYLYNQLKPYPPQASYSRLFNALDAFLGFKALNATDELWLCYPSL